MINLPRLSAFLAIFFFLSSVCGQDMNSRIVGSNNKKIKDLPCGTISPSYKQNIKDLGAYSLRQKNNGFTQLPMRVHIVRHTNGTGGVTMDVINHELSNLNYAMLPQQIEWFIKSINYIDDSNLYDFDFSQEESALCDPNQINDAVNVFWVNSISGTSIGSACGLAYYPANAAYSIRVFMDKDCAGGGYWETFVHEFGHHLNLYHTFEGTENGPNDPNAEHVPRSGPQSNCTTAGDLLCDTAADPEGTVDINCVYNSGGTDIYGNPYNPDVDNIMSYYPDWCGGTLFTSGQYTRINAGLSARLSHTAYDIDGAAPNIVADPSGLTASFGGSFVTLNWIDNSSNETGFLIERSTDGVNFEPVPGSGVASNVNTVVDDFNIGSNTTYYYRVKASNDDPDHYSNVVTITTGYLNYTCSTALPIDCGQYWSPGPDQGGGATHTDATHAVWYTYTPPFTGYINIYSCLGGTDTNLYLYTGSCGALNLLASNDDACQMTSGSSAWAAGLWSVPVTKDVPVLIEWDNKWSNSGFWFSLEYYSYSYCSELENLTATGTYSIPAIPCVNFALQPPAQNSVIYRFTPPISGTLEISSCNQNVNTNLWVYSGTCTLLNLIASSDDDCYAGPGLGNVASEVTGINVFAGVDIWLEWDDRWSSEGFDFTISIIPCSVTTYYRDLDGDSFGDINNPLDGCTQPSGYVLDNTDCDDNDANNYPGNIEICDGQDNDCDGLVDGNDPDLTGSTNMYFADNDGDSYGNPLSALVACTQPQGYVLNNTDCNDNCGLCYPGANEICDGLDNDCDTVIDEGCPSDCDYDYLNVNNPISSGIYDDAKVIQSNGTINNSPVTFNAEQQVILLPGFEVLLNKTLNINIVNCQ